MKINKIYIIFLLLLNACVSYGTSGFFLPSDKTLYYVKNPGSGGIFVGIYIPLDIKIYKMSNSNINYLSLKFPQEVGNGFETGIFFIPIPNKKIENNNDYFEIMVKNSHISMIDNFLENLRMFIEYDNKIYEGMRKENNLNKFTFPIEINKIRKGILIIEYKNYKKEVPFELKMVHYSKV